MKIFIIASLALAFVAYTADALFWPVAATGTAGAVTISGGALGAGLILAGAVALKGLALGALFLASRNRNRGSRRSHRRSYRRHGRSADEEEDEELDSAFALIAATEPEACYRRLICDLATGSMQRSENDVILSLFNKPVKASQPIYEYQVAALVGKQLKNVRSCELRYSCQMTGDQIQKLLKN